MLTTCVFFFSVHMHFVSVGRVIFLVRGSKARSGSRSHFWGFTITLRRITLGGTLLDEWLARRRELYLTTTHNIHKRQTSMPVAGFEPVIPAKERPQPHTLDCAASGIGVEVNWQSNFSIISLYATCKSRQMCTMSRQLRGLCHVSDKCCRENQTTHFMFGIFSRKSCGLWDTVEKYVRGRLVTDDNITRRRGNASSCWITMPTLLDCDPYTTWKL
jgi:hypothetical protein